MFFCSRCHCCYYYCIYMLFRSNKCMENANMCALGDAQLNSHKKFDSKSNTMCVDNKTKLWPVELFSIPSTIQGKRLLTAFQFCVKWFVISMEVRIKKRVCHFALIENSYSVREKKGEPFHKLRVIYIWNCGFLLYSFVILPLWSFMCNAPFKHFYFFLMI